MTDNEPRQRQYQPPVRSRRLLVTAFVMLSAVVTLLLRHHWMIPDDAEVSASLLFVCANDESGRVDVAISNTGRDVIVDAEVSLLSKDGSIVNSRVLAPLPQKILPNTCEFVCLEAGPNSLRNLQTVRLTLESPRLTEVSLPVTNRHRRVRIPSLTCPGHRGHVTAFLNSSSKIDAANLVASVNQQSAGVLGVQQASVNSVYHAAVSIELPSRPVPGTRLAVALSSPETRWAGVVRVTPDLLAGTNSSRSVPRIVQVHESEQWLELGVALDNDSLKTEARIHEVHVEGRNVTSSCRLPESVVPYRTGPYYEGICSVRVPRQLVGERDVSRIDLKYELVERGQPPAPGALESSRETYSALIHTDLPFPVGCSPNHLLDLTGFAAVQQVLHRDLISPKRLTDRFHTLRRSHPGVCGSAATNCRDADVVKDLAKLADAVVVTEPTFRWDSKSKSMSTYLNDFQVDGNVVIGRIDYSPALVTPPLRVSEVWWMTLKWLARGSRGVVYDVRSRSQEDRLLEPPSLERVVSAANDLQAILADAAAVPELAAGNQDGLDIGAFFSGSQDILLLIANDWCSSRYHPNGNGSEFATRHDVSVTVNGLVDGADYSVWNLVTQSQISSAGNSEGRITFALDPFRVGAIVLLTRRDRCPGLTAPKDPEIRASGSSPPKILPLENPFLTPSLVRLEKNPVVAFRVKNVSDEDLEVGGRWANAKKGARGIQSTVIRSDEVGVIELPFDAHQGEGFKQATIFPLSEPAGGFELLAAIHDETRVRATPTVVNLGRVFDSKKPGECSITLSASAGSVEIASAHVHINGVKKPIAVRNTDGKKTFLLSLGAIAVPAGAFNGTLEFDCRVVGESFRQKVSIPLRGHFAAEISASPHELVVTRGTGRELRQITVFSARALHEVSAVSDVAWVTVSASAEPAEDRYLFEVMIDAKQAKERSGIVRISASSPSGPVNLEVPVQVIGKGPDASVGAPSRKDDLLQSIDSFAEEALGYSHRELIQIDAAHSLLMLGPSRAGDVSNPHYQLLERILEGKGDDSAFVLRRGLPYPRRRGGVDGTREKHPNQYLHNFSMLSLPKETRLVVKDQVFTIQDLIQQSKTECRLAGELEWTVSAYSYYCLDDPPWKNKYGEDISFVALVRKMMNSESPSCGGGHRLLGLVRFMNATQSGRDPAIVALRRDVHAVLMNAMADAWARQRSDGVFVSDRALEIRDVSSAENMRYLDVHYTAHTLEWLLLWLGQEALSNDRVEKAISVLLSKAAEILTDLREKTGQLSANQRNEYTAVCHAVSALQIYSRQQDTDKHDKMNK